MKYLLSILFIVLISCSSSTSDEPNVSHDSDEWQIWAYSKAAPDFICLLYTSPSPRDRTRSRMPSSA